MVTVITTKEELATPVNHGVTGTDFAESERSYNYIKDYQEVSHAYVTRLRTALSVEG